MPDLLALVVQQSDNGVYLGCLYVMVALGLTLIYGVLNQINFAHADFVTVGIGAILHHDFAARSLADPAFRTRERPVPAADLRAEHVGPAFIDYLAAGWDDLIA